jgi:hypothetical protein
MPAKFSHDCPYCVFLGHAEGHDFYNCAGEGNSPSAPSLVAVASDEAGDYLSSPLHWARGRIMEAGKELRRMAVFNRVILN